MIGACGGGGGAEPAPESEPAPAAGGAGGGGNAGGSPAVDAGVRDARPAPPAPADAAAAAGPPDARPAAGPAPPSSWANVTGNLAGMASECGNLTMVSAKPGSSVVIAGVARLGLWASDDAGASWRRLGTGEGSASIVNRPSSITYDPKDADTFWESGIYNGGGIYKTADGGKTFKQLGSIRHNDFVSVDFSDPERKTLLAGGHEQKRTLYRSADGGATWVNVGPNLPTDSHFSTHPLVIDAQTHLVACCGWGSGQCGIWRTANGGAAWMQVSTQAATGAPLWTSSGVLYWPLIYNRGLLRSADQGQSWAQATSGTVTSARVVELPDGRFVTVGSKQLMISADGAAWKPFGDPLPYASPGVAYSAARKAFFIWRNDCGNAVLPNAIMSAGFDPAAP